MSRKHHAVNQPVTRRYVRNVLQCARDEIISAIVHDHDARDEGIIPWRWADEIAAPSLERLERAVNG